MNRDDIIRMAREVGAFPELSETPDKDVAFLARFAALVAAAEREKIKALQEENDRLKRAVTAMAMTHDKLKKEK